MKLQTRKQTLNLHFDKNGKAYFYNNRKQAAFFIPDKDLRLAYIIVYRHLIALSFIAVLSTLFSRSLAYAIIVGILIDAFLEYIYRQKMLARYSRIQPYIIHKTDHDLSQLSKGKIILKICLYFILALLLFWSIFTDKNEGLSLIILVIMGGISAMAGLQNMQLLFKK